MQDDRVVAEAIPEKSNTVSRGHCHKTVRARVTAPVSSARRRMGRMNHIGSSSFETLNGVYGNEETCIER